MEGTAWKRRNSILVFLFFLGVAVFITWPLLPNIANAIYGKEGDPVGMVWSLRWFKQAAFSHQGGILSFPYAGYPQGVRVPLYIWFVPLAPLYIFPRGEAVFYNLIILLSISLNGYLMFMLGKRLFRNHLAAAGMGVIYIFCPYALTRARYHLGLVAIFVFPLLLYTLLGLKENPTRANKAKFFLALLLALNVHPYYAPMTILLLAVLSILYLFRKIATGLGSISADYHFLRSCALLCVLAIVVTVPLTYLTVFSIRGDAVASSRQEGDLYTYAAHAWNYYIPSPNSQFMGETFRPFVRERVLSTNIEEFVLFLGYTNLGLALIALFVWFWRKRFAFARRLTDGLEDDRAWVIPAALLVALVFFLWSLPPTLKIGSLTLYLPSWLTYRFFPSLRVYARFGVLVFFSVTILSGACLYFLAVSLANRRRSLRYLVFAFLLCLIVCEFAEMSPRPLQRIYDLDPIYTEVEGLPADEVIVEYPFVAADEAFNARYLWDSIFHARKMLNGQGLGTEGEMLRNCVLNLFDPRTPGLLVYMGAGHAVLHKDLYARGSDYSYPPGDVDLDAIPHGYEVEATSEDAILLRISAERPPEVVLYDPSFSTAVTTVFGNGWWLGAEKRWVVRIDAQEDRVVDIRFRVSSPKGVRTLVVDLGRHRMETFCIGEESSEIVLEDVPLARGINRVRLNTPDDPVSYKEVFGGHDSKGICFAMSFWEIR